jgi:hypothetical protein
MVWFSVRSIRVWHGVFRKLYALAGGDLGRA